MKYGSTLKQKLNNVRVICCSLIEIQRLQVVISDFCSFKTG